MLVLPENIPLFDHSFLARSIFMCADIDKYVLIYHFLENLWSPYTTQVIAVESVH